jgi:hypothetical protein
VSCAAEGRGEDAPARGRRHGALFPEVEGWRVDLRPAHDLCAPRLARRSLGELTLRDGRVSVRSTPEGALAAVLADDESVTRGYGRGRPMPPAATRASTRLRDRGGWCFGNALACTISKAQNRTPTDPRREAVSDEYAQPCSDRRPRFITALIALQHESPARRLQRISFRCLHGHGPLFAARVMPLGGT